MSTRTGAACALAMVAALFVTSCSDGGSSDSARKVRATTSSSSSTTTTAVSVTTTGGQATGGGSATTAAPPSSPPTTTGPAKPSISSLNMPSDVSCTGSTTITVSWSYQDATSLTISIDGPGAYATYGPTGSDALPFACDGNPHTYTFTATGPGGTTTNTNTVLQQ